MKIHNLGNFLEKVRGGKLALGCCVTFADPAVTEVACAAGFDFVWIDGEHGHMDRNTAMAHMLAVKGTGVASFYRVPACDHTAIKQIIDFAPAGVIVPMVMDAADAATAVAACRYHTEGGNRGCGYRRGWDYGAAPAYGCSYNGFLRFRRFAEMFPQVKDKRWFVTEWRPWSDEDLQLQRIFHNVIWAGMYVQTSFCQKELDGFTMHELNSLSGVFYSSAHGQWNQYFDSWQNGRDLKAIAPKELRYEVSGMGTLFSLYNQGIITHPLIIGWGSRKHGTGKTGTFWESSLYNPYDAKNPDCQWTALVNPSRTSMCLLIANGSNDKLEVPVSCYGYRLLAKTHRFVTCDEEFLCAREVPGEEKPWRRLNWEVPSNGDPRDRHVVTIPPRSIGTVMIGITRWDEWWRVHIGRDLMKAAVREAGKSAPKDAEPYAECCGVEKGKPFMILPDGYPGHPEIKENLPARKLCLEIGKDPKKLDPAALEKARAEGYTVCADEQGNRAWLFKSKDIPAEQSAGLERRLKEMAGF